MKGFMKKKYSNVLGHFVKIKDIYGSHHSKMGMYLYSDKSLRLHIGTANLEEQDWNIYNQALWLSPSCPPLPTDAPDTAGESPTGFKKALIKYLNDYKITCLALWIKRVKRTDFSAVRVCLVTSVPRNSTIANNNSHLSQVGRVLSRYCQLPLNISEDSLKWTIIAQASNIGSLGPTPSTWLRRDFLQALASHTEERFPVVNSNVRLDIVYPSRKNVINSFDSKLKSSRFVHTAHEKQRWVESYLHSWRADNTNRTRSMPHIKSYCRVSPDQNCIAWYLLTSANISKAAWGTLTKDLRSCARSYEVGVLFLPKFFNEDFFRIGNPGSNFRQHVKDKLVFPFMYDLPLVQYKSTDRPGFIK